MRTENEKTLEEMEAEGYKVLRDPADALRRIGDIEGELNAAFPERARLARAALVALVAREHILVLGPPGTAKSAFARALSEATCGGSYFEILLTKFTTPEEMFGPLSFRGLKEDRYERVWAGYAPEARVWFVDEVWKASSSILNAMLTAMQERRVRQGGACLGIPLETIVAASNEYPEDDSLAAAYDRYALKVWVDYIADRDAFEDLLQAGGPRPVPTRLSGRIVRPAYSERPGAYESGAVSPSDLELLRAAAAAIPFGPAEARVLADIRAAVSAGGFVASDRTYVKATRIVQANALLNGHADRIQAGDWGILADVLWKRHTDRAALAGLVGNAADPYGARAEAILDAVRAAMAELPDLSVLKSGQGSKAQMIARVADVQSKVAAQCDALAAADEEAGGDRFAEAKAQVGSSQAQLDAVMREVTMYRAPRPGLSSVPVVKGGGA